MMPKAKPITVSLQGLSHTFRSKRAAAKAFGVCHKSFDYKLKAGWTIEESLALVVKTGDCVVCGEKFVQPVKGWKPNKAYCSGRCSDTTRDFDHKNALQRKRRKANPEKYRAKEKRLYDANPEIKRASGKKHYHANRERLIKEHTAWEAEQMKTNPEYALKKRLRDRIRKAIQGNYKRGSAVRDLGCSIPFFKKYIEDQFVDGMSWNNWGRGGWVLDHIIPLDAFDLNDREQLLKAVHYTNMQPLWEPDNLRKGSRIV